MEIIRCWQEEGVLIPQPYKRRIKVFLAPDRGGVREISFNHALIYPGSKTDYHEHDRPELILILTGRGISVCEGHQTPIEPDMALWVRAGEKHQVINTSDEMLKLATLFVPGFTAEDSYNRCLDAANEAQTEEESD